MRAFDREVVDAVWEAVRATPMRSYISPVSLGDVMWAFGIGPVVRSASERFSEGEVVTGFTGVQTRAVVDARGMRPVDMSLAPIEMHLSVLGMTGFTGYFGMLDLGRPEAGETVVVSAASGADRQAAGGPGGRHRRWSGQMRLPDR